MRRAGVAAAGLAVLALLSSCSGGGDDAGGASTTADPSSSSAGDEPVAGGTLRLGIARLASLDPADASPESPSASIAADLLFDGLTAVPPGGADAEPALASSWQSPDGGVTWRFTLGPEARFGDGTPVTAADVEASIERVKGRGVASLAAARLDIVVDVRAVDVANVEVVLARPMAALPELLAAPAYGVVPAAVAAAGADPVAMASVGSGSFRLAETAGDVLRLVRAQGADALLDGVELHQHDDLGAAYDAFEDGDLDWTLVAPDDAEAAAEAYGSEGFVPFQAELFFGFNLADPTFADARFRRAIVSAVDREAVVAAVYFWFADALDAVVPAGVPGHDAARCGPGCAFDQDAARRLLAEAFPDGNVPTVVIDHAEGADEAAVAAAVQGSLDAVGIPATLRPHPAAEFGAFAVSGGQALVRLGWIGTFPAPEAYLDPLFRTGAADNVTGFSDPAVDAVLDQASRTVDRAERHRLLAEAESLVLAAAPIVPIAQFKLLSVSSDSVQSLNLGVGGTFAADTVWLHP